MLALFHIILEIPLLSFTHSAHAHRMCPFRMTQRAPSALFLNAPLPLFQAAGNPNQPFSFNSLGLSAPEEACSRNVRASCTLKFGYEGILKISPRNAHGTYKVACTKCSCMLLSLYNAASPGDYVRMEFNARYEKKQKN